MKELTSKNLEVMAKLATLETTVIPLNAELKEQIREMEERVRKSEGYFKSLGDA